MAITLNESVPPSTSPSKPKRDTIAPIGFMKAGILPKELWPYHIDLSVPKYQDAAGFPEEDRDTQPMTIHDMRGQDTTLSLKKHGFLYAYDDCPELKDIEKCEGDKSRLSALMVPASLRLVKRLTGAEIVLPMMEGQVRNKASFVPPKEGDYAKKLNLTAPQREVHFDNVKWMSGKPLIPTTLKSTEENITTKHPDFAKAWELYESPDYVAKVINVWRPLKTIYRDPLVVCDSTSLDNEKDRVPVRFLSPGGSHIWWQRNRLVHNPNQKWCYLSAQEPSEPLVFTIYDESKDAEDPAFGLGHCAVPDPEYDNDAWPARESIECRYLALVPKTKA